ncbi:MAG: Glycogen synthase [Chlamydiae bacterium]|nr:Glycogen synthase [Chlamydiota bacterium]
MDIVHITSEIASIANVGGLGDAVYGLAQAEARLGKQVAAILTK